MGVSLALQVVGKDLIVKNCNVEIFKKTYVDNSAALVKYNDVITALTGGAVFLDLDTLL
jgi:hypothetical protein